MHFKLCHIHHRVPGSNAGKRECGIVEADRNLHDHLRLVWLRRVELHHHEVRQAITRRVARSEPSAGVHPRPSSVDLRRRSGGAQVEFVECILRWTRTASRSTTSPSPTRYSTRIQKAGVRPMVELGFMPKDLAAAVPGITEYQLHYPKPTMGGSSNNPPKDYKMWGELVRRYTEHLVQRYGRSRSEHLVLRSVERAGHRLLARHCRRSTSSSTTMRLPACARRCPMRWSADRQPRARPAQKPAPFLRDFLKHCLHDKSAGKRQAGPARLHLLPSQGPARRWWMAMCGWESANELQAARSGLPDRRQVSAVSPICRSF